MKLRLQWLFTAATLTLLCCLVPTQGFSQMDWLKTGKDLLGNVAAPSQQAAPTNLTGSEVTAGLKEALKVGSETVVTQLGRLDGFNADPAIHIPLPDSLQTVKSALSAVGMSAMMEDLELRLNRAAEEATTPTKKLFWDAIDAMTLDDAMAIYNGPEDAATRYFESKMSKPLSAAMQPIVEKTLAQSGAVQAYDAVMGQYATLPFVPDVKANLQQHVVDKGLAGIFHYLASEEAAIRKDPVKRTTDILQKVFGAK